MKHVVVVIFLLLALTSICTATPFEKNKLQVVYSQAPSFYSDSLFVLNPENNIVKLSFSGAQEWQLDPSLNTKQFQLHFNKLYALNEEGTLTRFDGLYGFKEWATQLNDIDSFQLSTPFIVVRNKAGEVSCIDSNSGHLLWTQKEAIFDDFVRVGRSAYIIGLSKGKLSILDIISGEIVDSKKLPKKKLKVLSTSNSSLFLNKGKTLFEFDLNKMTFEKIEGKSLSRSKKVFGHYFYTQSDNKINLNKFNLLDPLWTVSFDEDIKNVIFYPEYFVVQFDESKFQIYDSLTAHKITEEFEISLENISKSHFYPNDKNVIILDDKSIYTVKRVAI
jgi:hypothetical protein